MKKIGLNGLPIEHICWMRNLHPGCAIGKAPVCRCHANVAQNLRGMCQRPCCNYPPKMKAVLKAKGESNQYLQGASNKVTGGFMYSVAAWVSHRHRRWVTSLGSSVYWNEKYSIPVFESALVLSLKKNILTPDSVIFQTVEFDCSSLTNSIYDIKAARRRQSSVP